MGNPSLSLKFVVFLSISLTASSSSQFILKSQSKSPNPTPKAKATTSDLLSVLGPAAQSSKVNPLLSRQLKSCLKFLVPFTPPTATTLNPNSQFPQQPHSLFNRKLASSSSQNSKIYFEPSEKAIDKANELIWWPPQSVLELARLSFDCGGDPYVIHRALDPTVLPVPDIEGSKERRCQLTRTPYAWRFISEELNSYLKFLFEVIAARGPSVGLNVSLNRYDFFHGHLFIASETGRLGILFHAKEYPAYDKEVFPYNMGFCQKGSNVTYDSSMNLRNILWLAPLPCNYSKAWAAPGVLVVLDAYPEGIIYRDLIPDYVRFARTLYEDDFGEVAVDVNYLNVGGTVPNYKIFIC